MSRKRSVGRRNAKLRGALLSLVLATAGCGDAAEPEAQSANVTETTSYGVPIQQVEKAELLAANEDAFSAKLAVIDSAKAGDTLDLSYYIFEDDETSSYLATRLIAAAKRGAKVRVLLDFLANFPRYHYLDAIAEEANEGSSAGGSLEVRFYNAPSPVVQRDLRFLLTPCSLDGESILTKACSEYRKAHQDDPEARARAAQFLTGLFGKNDAALKAATAMVVKDFEDAVKGEEGSSTESVEASDVLLGLKLLYSAQVKGNIAAKLAVWFLSDKLAPLTGAVSSINATSVFKNRKEWQHLTDFTHQKLTLRTSSDSADMVLGGRNLQNAYHVSDLPPETSYRLPSETTERKGWPSSYTFIDTDMRIAFKGNSVRTRFEALWNFRQLVQPMSGPDSDLGVDPDLTVTDDEGNKSFVLPHYGDDYLEQASARFLSAYKVEAESVAPRSPGKAYALAKKKEQLPSMVADGASYHYVENIPNPNGKRVYGSGGEWGNERERGKEINALWLSALAERCASSEPKPVLIHSAYLMMPTTLQRAVFKAVSDPSGCPGVSKVVIATNSRASTDLNIINVLNESYIKPVLDGAAPGRLEYYEYVTHQTSSSNPTKRSLHSKVMIFGDDIFIGSANADGRTQFMDANNGVYIKNAPLMTQRYWSWMSSQVLGKLAVVDPHKIRKTPHIKLLQNNMRFLGEKVLGGWIEGDDSGRNELTTATVALGTGIGIHLYQVSSQVLLKDPEADAELEFDLTVIDIEDPDFEEPKTNKAISVMTDGLIQLL